MNTTLLKILVIILGAPLWMPFLRALWEEFNEALREEGGLLGREPNPKELERIELSEGVRPDPLVHEPWAEGRRGSRRPGSSTAQGQGPRRAGGDRGLQRRDARGGGFR